MDDDGARGEVAEPLVALADEARDAGGDVPEEDLRDAQEIAHDDGRRGGLPAVVHADAQPQGQLAKAPTRERLEQGVVPEQHAVRGDVDPGRYDDVAAERACGRGVREFEHAGGRGDEQKGHKG